MYYYAETAEETKELARRLARELDGGELLLLCGELGAGKTTFVQGLAEGLEASTPTSSPTFVLERRYPGRLELIHLDLYRLQEAREVELFIREALSESGSVVAVEWGDAFPEVFREYDAVRLFLSEVGDGRGVEISATGPASEELVGRLG